MKLNNVVRSLRAFVRCVPFQPFLIELVSGDRFIIRHPEAARFRGEVIVFVDPQGLHRLFDSDSVCQLLEIAPPTPP